MKTFSGSKAVVLSLLVIACLFLASSTMAQQFVVGSSQPAFADPAVSRPHTTPCVVPLFTELQFADFSIKNYSFTPPAGCPGPWEKIVLTADFNVTAGRQFDRTAIIDLGYVNIYFGTTPEPRHNLSPSWHFERDETEYAALFTAAQQGHVILGNVVNSTYTGVISGSAQLEFYPTPGKSGPHVQVADQVLPLTQATSGGINEPAFLFTPSDQLATTFTLPKNIERAYLDVITQSQSSDEFWYSCVPNDVAGELQSCGSTAFREAEISIDGQPAGVAPVYPWVFTGGVDPFLWEPIPGVQTLNFVPYRVDLTPFAGVLSNGEQHTVALSVFNSDSYFSATATLLLYLDHGAQLVTGALTENTIGAGPNPSVSENLQTDASGAITGSVTTTSSRAFKVAGYVNTSHGRVDTEVHQTLDFSNVQNFTINATTYVQDITQDTRLESRTVTMRGPAAFVAQQTFHYPLVMNIGLNFAPDGSFDQQTTVSQEIQHDVLTPFFASTVDNKVNSTDTLNFNSAGSFTGNTGAKSSQSFTAFDTRGLSYSCTLTSQNNQLATVSSGCPGSK